MKKIMSLLFLLAVMSVAASAVTFSDVARNSWYAPYVDKVSENEIINGVGENKYDPDGEFTVAQCLAIGSRIYSDGENIPKSDGAWYQQYVDYCIANEIVSDGEFDTYTRSITREETAKILYNCCADKLFPINNIKGIADVPEDDEEYDAILALYNAGVLTGSDDSGSFMPKGYIKRSEIAAICARILDESLRIKKELPYYSSPRYLIDDIIMRGPNSSIMSGWRLDNKYDAGDKFGRESNTVNADYGQKTALYRPINATDKGNVRFDVMMTCVLVNNGAYVSLDNDKNESRFCVRVNNGLFEIHSGDFVKKTDVSVNADISEHVVIVDASFETSRADVVIDGKTYFDVPFSADNIARLSIGFDGSGRGAITVNHVRCTADYRVNENFLSTEKGEGQRLFGRWQTAGNVALHQILSERGEDVYSARMSENSSAEITFEKIGGKVCFEVNVLIPDKNSNVRVGTDAFEIYMSDGGIYCNNTYLRHVAENVWTNIRFEMDFVSGTAFVRINGKDCGTHKMISDSSYASKALITLSDGQKIWFDDVKVFSLYDYDDYPEAPLSVNDDGYEIGVNVCNLWRNGNCGEGYDAVAPFDELYPYVGLADEGLPELADWEIKQMAEHGIDFQHICWYSPQNETDVPVKGTQMPQIALNDGYMKAKYSDEVKFCIMWENANGSVQNEEQFKKYIWPYFMEYYLSDPRYYSINNCAVITIWSRDDFAASFGGINGAKEITDFMREDVKKLGYDGLIIWFNGDASVKQIVNDMGGDAVYNYNYGRSGEHADYQIGIMNNNMNDYKVYYVPSVSVGFNAVGRHDERSGMITPDEHKRVCEYIRDEYIPTLNDGSWHDNVLMVSTWNEYTEGTYVAPSNLYGFDYIDNIRRVFTGAKTEHEDIVPSENVKDRLRNIYPDGFSPIRRYRLETGMEEFDVNRTKAVVSYDFSTDSAQKSFSSGHGLGSFGYRDGVLYGSSDASDFSFASISNGAILNVDETGARYLHIRMKSNCISIGQMFFTTVESPLYIAEACVSWYITKTDEFVDYYVDISGNNLWCGTLTGIRIDPMANPGSFEVELVEILSESATDSAKIFFDQNLMTFDFVPEYNESLDDFMVTLNPRLGFFSMSHTYHEFDVDKKTLYIESLKGNVLLVNDSDTAIVNGREVNTGFVFAYRDGLPVVPIKWLMSNLGFAVTEKEDALYFETADRSIKDLVADRKEGQWEFNLFGDTEGFTFQNNAGHVYDGSFNIQTIGNDNAIKNMNLDINLANYSKVTVGISYKTTAENPHIQVFFQTKAMSQMNEQASERIYLASNDTNGEFVEFTFDFSDNKDWKGVLTGLRLDPFHGMGSYSIDYIRLS